MKRKIKSPSKHKARPLSPEEFAAEQIWGRFDLAFEEKVTWWEWSQTSQHRTAQKFRAANRQANLANRRNRIRRIMYWEAIWHKARRKALATYQSNATYQSKFST